MQVYGPSFHCAVESLALFLAQFLGGPCDYSERRWSLSLREAHLRFKIENKHRDAWLRNMREALNECGIAEPVRGDLFRFFEQASAHIVNRPDQPVPEYKSPEADVLPEIAGPWNAHRALEETVAAIRRSDARRAVELTGSASLQEHFKHDRAALLSLLGVMIASGEAELLEYVWTRITDDPGIAREQHTYGRTLLNDAAGEGSAEMVGLLLGLGADPMRRQVLPRAVACRRESEGQPRCNPFADRGRSEGGCAGSRQAMHSAPYRSAARQR